MTDVKLQATRGFRELWGRGAARVDCWKLEWVHIDTIGLSDERTWVSFSKEGRWNFEQSDD